MRYLILILTLLTVSSCKKEEYEPPKQQYSCTDNQKKLMQGFITAYLNKRLDLNKAQKALIMPTLQKEALKTFCIIKRN